MLTYSKYLKSFIVSKIQTVCDPSWKGSEFPKWWTEYMEYNLAAGGLGVIGVFNLLKCIDA